VALGGFGGKAYLASRLWEIASKIPHIHRVEPYAGGLSFTLASEPEGYSEVVGDIHVGLTNFWRVLQDDKAFDLFKRRIDAVPFSEWEWKKSNRSLLLDEIDVSHAVAFFIHCRQSLAGRMKDFATLSRNRTRRGMNEQASAWLTCIEGLPAVHARLKRVVILNRPALDVIRQQDGENTLFYIDAPYIHDTRASTGEYEHEMTDEEHQELIDLLLTIKGKALVSMYHHAIYDVLHERHGWKLTEFDLPNNASGAEVKKRKIECVWQNG